MIKYLAVLWILSCLLGSYIYSIFFVNEVFPEPAFSLSNNDNNLIIFILFLISLIFSIPLIIIVKKISKSKVSSRAKYLNINLFLLIILVLTLLISSWLMVSLYEGIELIVSYGIFAILLSNFYVKNKINLHKGNF